MKRRMMAVKAETPKAINSGKAAQPEHHMRVKDPGREAASPHVKKGKPDTYPISKVPAKGRPKGGGNSMNEKLLNKRI